MKKFYLAVVTAIIVLAASASFAATVIVDPGFLEGGEKRKAAEQGDRNAQFSLGWAYASGQYHGIPQDFAKAFEWYLKAAEQGHANAQFNLGVMYDNAEGVAQDYEKALGWFYKAAGQGYVGAQTALGRMFQYGKGVKQDYAQAAEWYERAAGNGDAEAQNNLGMFYKDGTGVSQDLARAVELFSQAAEKGDMYGEYNLGLAYYFGNEVEQDYGKSLEWFRKSAEQGHSGAMFNAGVQYENGQGVPTDEGLAMEWFSRSLEAGNEGARKAVEGYRERGMMNAKEFFDLCGASDVAAVRKALDAGVNVNGAVGSNIPLVNALMNALTTKNTEVLRLLVERGANVNHEVDKKSVLATLVIRSDLPGDALLEVMGILLEAGADPNVTGPDGETLLMISVGLKHPQAAGIVELLLDAGADAKAKDKEGNTALDYAMETKVLDGTETLSRLRSATTGATDTAPVEKTGGNDADRSSLLPTGEPDSSMTLNGVKVAQYSDGTVSLNDGKGVIRPDGTVYLNGTQREPVGTLQIPEGGSRSTVNNCTTASVGGKLYVAANGSLILVEQDGNATVHKLP